MNENLVDGIKVLLLIIAVIVAVILFYALNAYLLMIAVGMVHHDWLHHLPTLSWHSALVLAWPIAIITGGGLAASSSTSKK